MNFLDYLISKKIDSDAFQKAEPDTWANWKEEFEQIHPNSFTIQKLNLINPVRRKYHLAIIPAPVAKPTTVAKPTIPGKPAISKPAIKPVQPQGQTAPQATTPPLDEDTTPAAAVMQPATPPANPTVPRPVFKPKIKPPVQTAPAEQAPLPAEPQPIPPTTEDAATAAIPPAKPAVPRPVFKPKIKPPVQQQEQTPPATTTQPVADNNTTPAPTAPPQASTESAATTSQQTTHASDTPPPAIPPVKPAMPRPVIKPRPKPE